MNTFLLTLMLLPVIVLLYAWLIYPLLLIVLAAGRHQRPAATPAQAGRPLAVLIAAFNEAGVISARLRNLLESDYPADHLQILVGTDGCTDNTAALAGEAARHAPSITVFEYPVNRGKTAVLKDLAEYAITQAAPAAIPLLVFTDANTAFRPDALQRLARHFDNPRTGGVCGRLVFRGDDLEEHTYWNLENVLKEREALMDSCLGANGAIYAIRPECFWKAIPANTIVDDFVIGMKVREAGFRMHYDPHAIATEESPAILDEWRRRIRIGSGDYQALLLCRRCLSPRFGIFAWMFWSHKILRWFTPHLLLLLLTGAWAAVIAGALGRLSPRIHLTASIVCAGAVLLIVAAAMGRCRRRYGSSRPGVPGKLCRGADHFLTMQAALLCGFIRFCRGNLPGTWTRTPRHADAE